MLLLGAVLLAACSTDPAAVPRRAAAFRPVPSGSPLRRLVRWDGTTFAPVAPASVSRGHLYVLVPGSAPRLVASLAAAITDGDPDAVVLEYLWRDAAVTGDFNGQRLAVALDEVLAPEFRANGGLVHLVGQGHGAKVAVVAGISLPQPPEQVTLLDSPAVNHLEGYLPLLPLGRTEGKTFVDSYYSLAGTRYAAFPALAQVVDVALRPRPHGYATRWYSDSARRASVGVGFGWSPLVGAPPVCLLCFYRQVRQLARPDGSRPDPLDLRLVPAPVVASRVSRRVDATVVRGPETGREPEGVELVAPGRPLWQMEFARSAGDLALSFDTRFIAPTPGAQLAAFLDGRQVFVSNADWVGSKGQHAVVDVSTLSEGTHTFTAVLARPGADGADVRRTRAVLGGFQTEAIPAVDRPAPGLSDGAQAALIALGGLALVALLAGFVVRRRRAATAVDQSAAGDSAAG